jgi:hypothetical protein
MLLFLNYPSFSQQKEEGEPTEKYRDSAQETISFNKKYDSLSGWKNSRDFAYMDYLDSLLRKQKELKSDTVNIHNGRGKAVQQRGEDSSLALQFLNSPPVKLFFWALALFFVAFILYRIILKNGLFTFNKTKSTEIAEDDLITLNELSQYDSLIAEAEINNDFNLATRYSFLKAIKTLSDKEIIHFLPDKTNREYVKEMERHSLAKEFSSLTRSYEYVWYGKFLIDKNQYKVLKEQFVQFIKKV